MAKLTLKNDARKFYGFDDWQDVLAQFAASEKEPTFVYAVYSTPPYEGSAGVVFFRDGKWWEANGGHCSCYGLEGQWKPTEIDPTLHLKAVAIGKRDLCMADTEGVYPEATQEAFDTWLEWAFVRAALTDEQKGRE